MAGRTPPVGVLACWVAALALGIAAFAAANGPVPAAPSLTAAVSPALPGANPGRLPGLLASLVPGRRSPRVIAVYGSGVAGRWSYSVLLRGPTGVIAADVPGAHGPGSPVASGSGWPLAEFTRALAELTRELGGWGPTGLLDGTRVGILTGCRTVHPGGGAQCASVTVRGPGGAGAGASESPPPRSAGTREPVRSARGTATIARLPSLVAPTIWRVVLRVTLPCGWLAVAEIGGPPPASPGPALGELGGVGGRSISGAGYCGVLVASPAVAASG